MRYSNGFSGLKQLKVEKLLTIKLSFRSMSWDSSQTFSFGIFLSMLTERFCKVTLDWFYSRLPVFRTDTYSNFPLIRSVFHFPQNFLNKLMQIPSVIQTCSYSKFRIFEVIFLFPLTKHSSVIQSFSKNSDLLHCLKTQKINRNSDFIYSKKSRFYSSCNIFIILQYPVNCRRQRILISLMSPKFTAFPVILT